MDSTYADERLALLPELLGIVDVAGGLRISAQFAEGRLAGEVRLVEFRIPANGSRHAHMTPHVAEANVGELELLAHDLAISSNVRSFFVAEYAMAESGPPKLRWLDVGWDVRAGS